MRALRPASSIAAAWVAFSSPAVATPATATPATATPALEVIVRGDRPLRSPASAGQPSTRLEGEALHRAGSSTADVLSSVPGASVQRRGGHGELATVGLRGASSRQTAVTLWGIALNDDLVGAVDMATFPPWLLQRIDVFRGHPGPSTLDGGVSPGLGGEVRLEPKLPRHRELGRGGELTTDSGWGGWLYGSQYSERASASIGLGYAKREPDYRFYDDRGTVFDAGDDVLRSRTRAALEQRELWAIVEVPLRRLPGANLRLRTLAHASGLDQALPGTSQLPFRKISEERRRDLVIAQLQHESEHAPFTLTSYTIGEINRTSDPERELSNDTRSSSTGRRSGALLRFEHPLGGGFRIHEGFGAAISQVSLSSDSPLSQGARTTPALVSAESERFTASTGIGIGLQRGLPRGEIEADLSLNGVLHADRTQRRTEVLGAPSANAPFLPNTTATLAYLPHPKVRLGLAVSHSQRAPSLGERFGLNALLRGNAALLPESAWNVDVGVQWSPTWSPAARAGVRGDVRLWAYAAHYNNLIAYRRSNFAALTPFNLAHARQLGLECEASLRIWNLIELGSSFAFVDPRQWSGLDAWADRSNANPLTGPIPYRSRWQANHFFALETPGLRRLAFDGLRIEAALDHRASLPIDPAGLIRLPPQEDLSLNLTARFFSDRVLGRMAIHNLLNQPLADALGFPRPGRALTASLETVLRARERP